MAFRYANQPLSSPRDFRLLSLLPGSGSATVECEVKTISLENAPRYEALSYVWGDLSDMVPIRCEGQELHITQNLHAALLRLRCLDQARIIWIDAICIDQTNDSERSAQVQLMRDIYAGAKIVNVWLGEAVSGLEETWEFLESMSQKQKQWAQWYDARPNKSASGSDWKQTIDAHEASAPKELNLPSADSAASQGLKELLQRSWFTRSWVFPEVSVSSDCTVLCGGFATKWNNLILACQFIRENETDAIKPIQEAAGRADYMTVLYRSQNAPEKDALESVQEKPTLFKLLSGTRSLQASNPRDKIYSLLGLCFGNPVSDGMIPPLLRPDYSASVAEIYARAAHYILTHSADLELLSHVIRDPDSKTKDDLPTWVPDWQAEVEHLLIGRGDNFAAGPRDPISSFGSLKQRKYSRQSDPPPHRSLRWQAENRYGDEEEEDDNDENGDKINSVIPPRSVIPPSSDPFHLHIRGVTFDKIRATRSDLWITDVHLASKDTYDSVNDIQSSTYEQFWSTVRSFYKTENVRPELYSAPLGGHLSPPVRARSDPFSTYNTSKDAHNKGQSAPSAPSLVQIQSLHIRTTRASLALPTESFRRGATREDEATGWQYLTRFIPPAAWGMRHMVRADEAEDMAVDRLTRECWLLMARMRVGRSVIVTEKGWIGIAPEWVKKGDAVVVAKGGRVPLVLREAKEGGLWKLVGECYVHNIMSGEMADWDLDGKELEEKDYLLC